MDKASTRSSSATPAEPRCCADHGDPWDPVIGQNGGLHEAIQKARLLAKAGAPILLQGETGVGKELFARAIHESQPRRHAPFVALNCGGLPRELLASELFGYVEGAFTGARRSGMVGKIEAAHGGTLFLDELTEMPPDIQPYFLRVLEGGEFYPLGGDKARLAQFRLVSACNKELRAEVSAGRFRMDLFYRVSVTSLYIPPLRERREDLSALVAHFARQVAGHHGVPVKRFAPEVMATFARHAWPGNLRELRNAVESMVLLTEGSTVGLAVLPADLTDACPASAEQRTSGDAGTRRGLEQVERDAIGAAIRVHGGNLTAAARDLHISRSTLYLKMKKYGLESILREVRLTRAPAVSSGSPVARRSRTEVR